MERISSQMLNGNTRPTPKAASGQEYTPSVMTHLMNQAKAYFPMQVTSWAPTKNDMPGTEAVFMREWLVLVERYGIERFQNAIGNVLRKSGSPGYEWFPLPAIIGAECAELKALTTEQQGSRENVYRCPHCDTQAASQRQPREAPACPSCGRLMAFVARGADAWNPVRYMQRVAEHPEEFFGEATLLREVNERIAKKVRAA